MVLSIKRGARRTAVPKMHTQQLIDMPLDVVIEIFLFLEPLDLLHLARTAKPLREFLLSRTKSSALWKDAIGKVERLPPCPDYMSAPAYTHLAFVPVCHGCFCYCETIKWELRLRCCPECDPKLTRPFFFSKQNMKLPFSSVHCELKDGLGFYISVSLRRTACSYSRLDWEAATSGKPWNAYLEEVQTEAQWDELWQSIQMHARSCRDWECTRLEEKAGQLMLARKQKIKDIENKLKKLGYADFVSSVEYSQRLSQLPEVRKPGSLTPEGWDCIRPQLLSWAEKAWKEVGWNHCISSILSVFRSIQQELQSDNSLKVHPREVDVILLPAVESAMGSIARSRTGMSYDDLKKKFLSLLPPAIRKWSAGAVQELEQLTREQLRLPPLSKPSRLPWAIFRCTVCPRSHSQRLRFDEALNHHHLYKTIDKVKGKTKAMFAYEKFKLGLGTQPRNIRPLRIDVTASRRAENLIKRMGQNPNRVTQDELRRSTIKVVCGLCGPQVATRMDFACALQHCLDAHLWKRETEIWTRTRASARD